MLGQLFPSPPPPIVVLLLFTENRNNLFFPMKALQIYLRIFLLDFISLYGLLGFALLPHSLMPISSRPFGSKQIINSVLGHIALLAKVFFFPPLVGEIEATWAWLDKGEMFLIICRSFYPHLASFSRSLMELAKCFTSFGVHLKAKNFSLNHHFVAIPHFIKIPRANL